MSRRRPKRDNGLSNLDLSSSTRAELGPPALDTPPLSEEGSSALACQPQLPEAGAILAVRRTIAEDQLAALSLKNIVGSMLPEFTEFVRDEPRPHVSFLSDSASKSAKLLEKRRRVEEGLRDFAAEVEIVFPNRRKDNFTPVVGRLLSKTPDSKAVSIEVDLSPRSCRVVEEEKEALSRALFLRHVRFTPQLVLGYLELPGSAPHYAQPKVIRSVNEWLLQDFFDPEGQPVPICLGPLHTSIVPI